jgi:protein arginine kinase activator
MKCQHCGKNEVTFVYQSNINGKVETAHLCGDCAQKLGYVQRIASGRQEMRQNMNRFMEDSFPGMGSFGNFGTFALPGLLGGNFFGENLFDDFFQQMPALGVRSSQPVLDQPLVEPAEQERISKQRELNALKMEQKAAVEREDFEKAAQIRDKIRELEKE